MEFSPSYTCKHLKFCRNIRSNGGKNENHMHVEMYAITDSVYATFQIIFI
jgi:hypothetical protein